MPINPTERAKRQYKIRFWIAMIAYVAVVYPVTAAASHQSGPARILIALIPIIPIAAVLASFVAMIRNIDELERQIHVESLAIAAGLTAILAVTYGFLEVAGFPRPSAWFTYGVVMLAWAVATPFVSRRYKE